MLGYSLTQIILNLEAYEPWRFGLIVTFLSINTAVLGIVWLGSIKDLTFSTAYAVMQKKLKARYEAVENFSELPSPAPRFLLLYCTCNDFNAKALAACMKQDYPNFTTVILDDSSEAKYRSEINRFANRYGDAVEVVRREEHKGYKAGNLNHYLAGRTDYDYFVVLDSDEIIPNDYIRQIIKYFRFNPACGAVQARHKAQKGENVFQRLMGLSVGSNGATVQIIKNFYGSNALIGHGMTVSRACYTATGGFPLVVAEDISFAVEIKNAGFDIIYAPDILCFEEFPVDYVSLKKRQCKWTQGNLEYMKKYDKDINHSKMSWYEKLDIKLSHYSLPIVPILSLLLTVCTLALGLLGYSVIRYSFGIYVIMLVFLCSPMIPDLFVYHRDKNGLLLLPYFIVNVATYASLGPMMIRTVIMGLCGKKAVFLVTPKQSKKFTLLEILRYSCDSLLFAAVIGALSYLACESIVPVIFLFVGCLFAPVLIVLSNFSLKSDETKQDDAESALLGEGNLYTFTPQKLRAAKRTEVKVRAQKHSQYKTL